MMATLPAIDHDLKFPVAEEPKVLKAEFGDGYSQRVAEGINPIKMEVNLTWSFLTLANVGTLKTFFRANVGINFDYQLPQEAAARKWICETWEESTVAAGVYTLTARFVEVFDL